MLTLAKQLEKYSGDYVRGGGKDHRKKQVKRIIGFLDWVASSEKVISLHGLGKKHVIGFWKAHRHLSDETLHKYWLGISELWRWLDKHGEPPAPHKAKRINKPELTDTDKLINTGFTEVSLVIKSARELLNLTIQQLANMSGIETLLIENIEAGETNIRLSDALCLFEILKIKFSV